MPPSWDFRLVEQLDGETLRLVQEVTAGPMGSAWPAPWHDLAHARLALAAEHLAAAKALDRLRPRSEGAARSTISRSYYAMFCAVRAVVSLDQNADANEHKTLPNLLAKSSIGAKAERDPVVASLARFRAHRNDADYSVVYPRDIRADAREAVREATKALRFARAQVRAILRTRTK